MTSGRMLAMGVLASAAATCFAGCGSSDYGESPTAVVTPGVSPSVPVTGAPSATAAPLSPNRVELLRDDTGYWIAEDLIRGKHQVLVEKYLDDLDDFRTTAVQIGFVDLDSGDLNPFRELPNGEQISDPDNDGRFLAWAEVGIMGMKETRWRVMVMDLENGEMEEIDALPADVDPPGSGYGTPLAVDGGRLVYGALVADGTEVVQELRLRDLVTGTESVIEAQPLSESRIWDLDLSGDLLLLVQRHGTATEGSLYLLDLAGVEDGPQQVASRVNRVSVSDEGRIIATTPNGILAGRVGEELEQVYTSGLAPFHPTATATGGFWIDQESRRAMALNVDGSIGELSPEYTSRVFSDGQILAWMESLGRGGQGDPRYVVAWRDVAD